MQKHSRELIMSRNVKYCCVYLKKMYAFPALSLVCFLCYFIWFLYVSRVALNGWRQLARWKGKKTCWPHLTSHESDINRCVLSRPLWLFICMIVEIHYIVYEAMWPCWPKPEAQMSQCIDLLSIHFTSSWDENPQSLSHGGLGARPEMICVLGNA